VAWLSSEIKSRLAKLARIKVKGIEKLTFAFRFIRCLRIKPLKEYSDVLIELVPVSIDDIEDGIILSLTLLQLLNPFLEDSFESDSLLKPLLNENVSKTIGYDRYTEEKDFRRKSDWLKQNELEWESESTLKNYNVPSPSPA